MGYNLQFEEHWSGINKANAFYFGYQLQLIDNDNLKYYVKKDSEIETRLVGKEMVIY